MTINFQFFKIKTIIKYKTLRSVIIASKIPPFSIWRQIPRLLLSATSAPRNLCDVLYWMKFSASFSCFCFIFTPDLLDFPGVFHRIIYKFEEYSLKIYLARESHCNLYHSQSNTPQNGPMMSVNFLSLPKINTTNRSILISKINTSANKRVINQTIPIDSCNIWGQKRQ